MTSYKKESTGLEFNFHFSPFLMEDGFLNIYNGEYIIRDGRIFKSDNEMSPEMFYDEFVEISKDKWFVKDFKEAFSDTKRAIPHSLLDFAIYCSFKFTFLTTN